MRVPLSARAHACVRGVCRVLYTGCTHAYLSFKPLDLSVLVLQLSAELIGCDLLRLHDLHQVDVLLHQDLTLDDDVGVTEGSKGRRTRRRLEEERVRQLMLVTRTKSSRSNNLTHVDKVT